MLMTEEKPEQKPEQKFYTLRQVASILNVSPETIRRLIVAGELGAKQVRRQYRISQENLDKYLAQK